MFPLPPWARYVIFPLIGAILGYSTNWIAITLLFRPRKPFLGIQGLLHKRKNHLAEKIAKVVSTYLLNMKEMQKVVDKEKIFSGMARVLEVSFPRLPPMIRNPLLKTLQDMVAAYVLDKEGRIRADMLDMALNDTDLEKIIMDKIRGYDVSELEGIIKSASGYEIQFIIFSGGVLGLIVGIIEALLPL